MSASNFESAGRARASAAAKASVFGAALGAWQAASSASAVGARESEGARAAAIALHHAAVNQALVNAKEAAWAALAMGEMARAFNDAATAAQDALEAAFGVNAAAARRAALGSNAIARAARDLPASVEQIAERAVAAVLSAHDMVEYQAATADSVRALVAQCVANRGGRAMSAERAAEAAVSLFGANAAAADAARQSAIPAVAAAAANTFQDSAAPAAAEASNSAFVAGIMRGETSSAERDVHNGDSKIRSVRVW